MPTERGSSHRSPSRGAHDRLVQAVTTVAARDGYANLTVGSILAQASVSRATFYQHFENVEDCFWTAYRLHSEQLVSDVRAAARNSRRRELAVLDALVATATMRPEVACVLMREGLAAGLGGLSKRDALMSGIERAMTATAHRRSAIDLPAAVVVGATFRFLSMRLAEGSPLDGLRDEVREWAETFVRRSSCPPWTATLSPLKQRRNAPVSARPSTTAAAGTVRERILRATAASICARGYRAVTVADVVLAAGVSRRGFYNEFRSTAEALAAVYEYTFHQTLAACAPAFFTPRAWPERVWHGAQAFAGFLYCEPSVAYVGFAECHAIGPGAVSRVHDTQLAFALFLEEGHRQRPESEPHSRACAGLTAGAIFETGFQGSRRGASGHSRCCHPLAVYIALAPFIGRDEAGEFVLGKLSAEAHSEAPGPA